MSWDPIREEMREIIRQSEIKAVARELRSGNRPHIGQLVDYYIEAQGTVSCLFDAGHAPGRKPTTPFRLVVEQWHLDAANRMLDHL